MTFPKNLPWRFGGFLLLGCGLAGGIASAVEPAPATLARFEFTEPHMAVDFRIVLYAHDEAAARRAADAAFARI